MFDYSRICHSCSGWLLIEEPGTIDPDKLTSATGPDLCFQPTTQYKLFTPNTNLYYNHERMVCMYTSIDITLCPIPNSKPQNFNSYFESIIYYHRIF